VKVKNSVVMNYNIKEMFIYVIVYSIFRCLKMKNIKCKNCGSEKTHFLERDSKKVICQFCGEISNV